MTEPMHTLQAQFEAGYLRLGIICHEHEASLCHLVCDEGCESWNLSDHVLPGRENGLEEGHRLTRSNMCNAVEWFDATGDLAESYHGQTVSIHDGMPVDIAWTGDCYIWSEAR